MRRQLQENARKISIQFQNLDAPQAENNDQTGRYINYPEAMPSVLVNSIAVRSAPPPPPHVSMALNSELPPPPIPPPFFTPNAGKVNLIIGQKVLRGFK